MAERNESNVVGDIYRAVNGAQLAYISAGSAITPDQENREFRIMGNNLALGGALMTAFSYDLFINPPARNRAYEIPTYMLVTPLAIQGFTFVSGITAMAIGWLLIVSDNPRQYDRLVKVILLLVLFASSFAMGMLL